MSLRPALAGLTAAAALLLCCVGAARAECPYFVIPPATQAAGSARDLLVGTVVDNPGGQVDDFTLRVDLVLRGTARVGEARPFSMLYPGWPPLTNADGTVSLDPQGRPFMPCAPIRAWKGDVIVLALNALAPDGRTRYNAASWISGGVPFETDLPRTTLGEIKRLAGIPDTATLAQPDRGPDGPGVDLLSPLLLGAGLGFGAVVGWRRASREARPDRARP